MRNRVVRSFLTGVALLSSLSIVNAQQAAPVAATALTPVPALVPYSGIALDGKGRPLAGETSATFLIYKDQQGGEPLFAESQMISFDEAGLYKVQLGAGNPNGLPSGLFLSGEARWLEVQIAGETPQARVLLASVPYALKAADAATLGGLPASAFALAGSKNSLEALPAGVVSNASSTVTTTGGVSGYMPRFNGASTVVDSEIFDTGTDVGIGTASPTATLDVNGTAIITGGLSAEGGANVGGSLNILATGNATASAGKASQPLAFVASSYNSSSKAAVPQIFRWTAEPTGNDTASPSSALELLFSSGSGTPTATGLSINGAGQIHFANGQTFGASSSSGVAFNGTSTSNTGVEGTSSAGSGVVGTNANTTVGTAGVLGVAGERNTSGFTGIAGVWGDSSVSVGVFGSSDQSLGVYGQSATSYGVGGATYDSTGAGSGVYGYASTADPGVKGASAQGSGGIFYGGANYGIGVEGIGGSNNNGDSPAGYGGEFTGGSDIYDNGGAFGIFVSGGTGDPGNEADGTPGGTGAYILGGGGWSGGGSGVTVSGGLSQAGNAGAGGVFVGGTGTPLFNGIPGDGITAKTGFYGDNTGDAYADAGYFLGNVEVTGTVSSQGQVLQVDHPLDPANKFLTHIAVESSEMVNVYSGNVTTDELGLATVKLPDWFEAVNGDFRYQLTIVGRKAQAWISREVDRGSFQIASDATNVKISWQITAVRQDAYAKAHPLVVEQAKNARERGFYKHPELYGQPQEKQAEWGRHPEIMLQIKAMHEAPRSRGQAAPGNGTAPGKPAGHPGRSSISAKVAGSSAAKTGATSAIVNPASVGEAKQ